MVTVVAVKSLKKRVNLDQIKDNKKLNHLALVRQSRLSVMPIDAKSWKIICNLGGIK
jgi:predicted RNA-binding protein with PUA-like domain